MPQRLQVLPYRIYANLFIANNNIIMHSGYLSNCFVKKTQNALFIYSCILFNQAKNTVTKFKTGILIPIAIAHLSVPLVNQENV